jgi:hypothetical protein
LLPIGDPYDVPKVTSEVPVKALKTIAQAVFTKAENSMSLLLQKDEISDSGCAIFTSIPNSPWGELMLPSLNAGKLQGSMAMLCMETEFPREPIVS